MVQIGNQGIPDELAKLLNEDEYEEFAKWLQEGGANGSYSSDASGSDVSQQVVNKFRQSKSNYVPKDSGTWENFTSRQAQQYGI